MRLPSPSIVATHLVASVALAGSARADVVVLEPVADATLIQQEDVDPTEYAAGASQYLFAGRVANNGGGRIRRAFLRFDLAAIPAGAQVVSASLTVTLNQAVSPAQPFELHAVGESWGEGPSNADGGSGTIALEGDATWRKRFYPDIAWTTPGGVFDATASSSMVADLTGPYTFPSTPALVADVQGWLDAPATNFGWAMLGNESVPGTVKRFVSRNSTNASQRPKLTIEYTLPVVGDLDGNGIVNGADLGLLLGNWGGSGVGDLDGSGSVDGADIGILLGHWSS
ncbi:MAG: DNRLRE domain-containing protein [Phycisphaerales bacterium]